MEKNIQSEVLKLTGCQKILKQELIQNLWSGYGTVQRLTLDDRSVILKLIKFPNHLDHPRGWNSNLSHQRKVKSYQVEMNWYANHNTIIEHAYSPQLIGKGEVNDSHFLILEDLKDRDQHPKDSLDWSDVKLCLKWLATFHAKYMGVKYDDLWSTGTYWHLETRPEELEVLEDLQLKDLAYSIDKKLSSSKHQTIVHGDAKLSNFLFGSTSVSAVDFQYVGSGVGVKDLAYFLSSIYYETELFDRDQDCLKVYFEELKTALSFFHPHLDGQQLEDQWRELYPYAWCDFYRFLKGWSPHHAKINAYSEKMKEKVLNDLIK